MRFIIEIHVDETQLTYPIDAQNEEEAKVRLALRLPPSKRESIVIDNISVEPKNICREEPYGIFAN